MKVKLLSRVRLCGTPWTAAYQAPPSMRFSRQEYWSGVPLLSPNRRHTYFKLCVDRITYSLVLYRVRASQVVLMVKNPRVNAGDIRDVV